MNDNHNTRRLQPLGTDRRPAQDQETQRLSNEIASEATDDGLLCLRCGGVMVETRTWAVRNGLVDMERGIVITLRDDLPSTGLINTLIGCISATCVECGYTELYADQEALRAALINYDRRRYQRSNQKRRSQR